MLAEDQSVVSGQNCLLVNLDHQATKATPTCKPNCPMIGIRRQPPSTNPLGTWVDLVIQLPEEHTLLEQIVATITAQPLAASTFIGVLRESENLSISQGLMVESLAYSTLQNSQGFRAWLSDRTNSMIEATAAGAGAGDTDDGPTVLVERDPKAQLDRQNNQGDTLALTLNRPAKRNAFSAAMRDELTSALNLALADDSIAHIELSAHGSAFCAGGDLTEFGHSQDAALAHLTRLTRSPANLMALLRSKILVRLHGACIGAGIELPAFASNISAKSNSVFALPEVGFGLIPGAGGTVSIPRRIGRQNTAKLGLSGVSIDAEQALRWGLIDVIEN